jgi:glutamyl/glutaminyl-tRNA synthetase
MSTNNPETPSNEPQGLDFVRRIVEEDLRTNRWNGRVATRFPPEPNGYLHIGHAKSICLNFGIAEEYHGECNLRYDDTNPAKEEEEYVKAIEEDVKWLGFKWSGKFWASDYFDTMYDYAVELIMKGKAYVDDQSAEEQPVSQSQRLGKPRSFRSHAQRRISRRFKSAARQDRYDLAELQHARPGDVSRPARIAPQHRRQMVHLSDVRLGPRV